MSNFRYTKINIQGKWHALKLVPVSDGDPKQYPSCPPYRPSSDENYLIQLAAAWRPNMPPAFQYYIEELPDGYKTFEIDQPGGSQTYKRLFGHPSGRFYDSIQKFKPHFLWLMSGKQKECECQFCSKRQMQPIQRRVRAPPREVFNRNLLRPADSGTETDTSENNTRDNAGSRRGPRRDQRAAGAPTAVDEEGTEDVYKKFVLRLFNARDATKGIDEDIREDNSIDWKADHHPDEEDGLNLLPNYLKLLKHQPSYLPRIGELVLWCQDFLDDHYLLQDNKTGQYKFFSRKLKRFSGVPKWRAGVITSAPNTDAVVHNGPVDFQDILQLPAKTTALSMAGFRVETLPDPNDSKNKSASKQYKWLPLRNIRPLAQWQAILTGVPQEELHPSILNALTCATTVSLLEKFKATGQWPQGVIHCKAIHLGSELISVGDTVRLTSDRSQSACADILRVESIRLNLEDMKPEYASAASPYLASKTWISFVGKAYTKDGRRHWAMPSEEELRSSVTEITVPEPVPELEAKLVFHGIGAHAYGPWYHLHEPRFRYEVSHEQVLGRLYEANAVRLWTAQVGQQSAGIKTRKVSLSHDVRGIIASRQYATQMDRRLPESKENSISWYWADTRALALAVESFNSLAVGKYWLARDKPTLNQWQEQVKILNGVQIKPGMDNSFVPLPQSTRGRKPGTKIINGKLVKPGDPEYEAVFGKAGSERPKPISQMAGAAMASTDEESEAEADLATWTQEPPKWKASDDDSVEIYEPQTVSEAQGPVEPVLGVAQPRARPDIQSNVKAPLSKSQIMGGAVMQSIEGDDSSMDEYDDEYDWPEDYVPPARGGTEESEGGDYDPSKEARHRGRHDGDDDW